MDSQLLNKDDFYKKAMDGCGDPLVIYDQKGCARYVNPAFERVFGWSFNEVAGRRIDFVPQQSVEQTREAISRVVKGQTVLGMETVRKTKDNRLIHTRLSANAIVGQKGAFDGIIVTLQDISELVQSRQVAQMANNAKENFLSNISHEIRTPMNGLMGILDLLENTRLNTEQQEYVSVLQKSAKVLMKVIGDILDFSRIKTGGMVENSIDFDLRVVLDALVQASKEKVEKNSNIINLTVDQNVPSLLIGDPEKLRQIVAHLLDNAGKFTTKGRIDFDVTIKQESADGVHLCFEIRDDGIGIESNALNHIFDAFSQVDDSSTRKFGGVGLGLSLTKKLVEFLNGRIRVLSQPGKGSVFTVELPFKKQDNVLFAALEKPDSIKGKQILIVDKDDANRLILKEIALKWGCKVQEAANAQRAMEKVSAMRQKNEGYDIFLVGMTIASQHGEKLVGHIRSEGTAENIVIMLCEHGLPGDVNRLERIGVQGYMPLPADPQLLFDCITTAMAIKKTGKNKVITRHFLKEIRKQQVSILLIDSQSANNKIILNILKKSGYSVETAFQNKSGIKKFQTGKHHLVLISVDPTQDESVDTINAMRDIILENKIKKCALIAMIPDANAKDDHFKVDDYLVKPVTADLLLEMISEWTQRIHPDTKKSTGSAGILKAGQRNGVFDFNSAYERAMEDKVFLIEVLDEFCGSMPKVIAQIKECVRIKDIAAVSIKANALKGASSNIGAERIRNCASEMEKSADLGNLDRVEDLINDLSDEFTGFKGHISQIKWSDV